MAKIIFLISLTLLSCYLTEQTKLSHDNMTENKETTTSTPGQNVDLNSATEKHKLMLRSRGLKTGTKSNLMYKTNDRKYAKNDEISKEFDARKRWPECKTIGEVHNDGNSRLSWAYATTGTLADRKCIATNGSYNQLLSTEHLISCSGIKYTNAYGDEQAWEYFHSHGVVSGGKYNTNDGCQPSTFPPILIQSTTMGEHKCHEHCYANNTIDYSNDHVKVSNSYALFYKNIQKEVQTYGPVTAYFLLYDDFYFYKSGVYTKSEKAKLVRGQFAKLIGWGVENGVDYWLLVNSWGHSWGRNGHFKIKRGTNECEIDTYITAGVPAI